MVHVFETEKERMKGGSRVLRVTRKGAKDSRIKLVWSKYYKYLLDDEEYFIKEKAYATYCDAWIDIEKITRQTYKRAIKRRNECIEIDIRKDIEKTPIHSLALIFKEKYHIGEDKAIDLIIKTRKRIEKLKEDSQISKEVEYVLFIKMIEACIDFTKGEI